MDNFERIDLIVNGRLKEAKKDLDRSRKRNQNPAPVPLISIRWTSSMKLTC